MQLCVPPPADLMKVLVIGRGKQGDTEPFFAVVARLVESGVRVTMCTTFKEAEFMQAVDDCILLLNKHMPHRYFAPAEVLADKSIESPRPNLEFTCHPTFGDRLRVVQVEHDINQAEESNKRAAWAAAGAEGGTTVKTAIQNLDRAHMLKNVRQMASIVEEFMPDVIVDSTPGITSQLLGQAYSIPGVCLAPLPPAYASFDRPHISYSTPYRYGILNYLSWFYAAIDVGRVVYPRIKETRAVFNLPTMFNLDAAERQFFTTISATLFPKPRDLPARATYFPGRTVIYDSEHLGRFTPSAQLLNFLQLESPLAINKHNSKTPVVFIGLGSMPFVTDENLVGQVAADLFQAAKVKKIRLVLQGGALGQVYEQMIKQAEKAAEPAAAKSELDDVVQHIKSCPHGWLFTRVDGVIHHGGVGTTMTALASGTPSAIFPIGFDQPFWAYRLHEMVYKDYADKVSPPIDPTQIPPFEVHWAAKAKFSDFVEAFNFMFNPSIRNIFELIGKSTKSEPNCIEEVVNGIYKFHDSKKNITARKLGIIPKWKLSTSVSQCEMCNVQFGYFKWKYQCLACGQFICYNCRDKTVQAIATFGRRYPCTQCAKVFQAKGKAVEQVEKNASGQKTEQESDDEKPDTASKKKTSGSTDTEEKDLNE